MSRRQSTGPPDGMPLGLARRPAPTPTPTAQGNNKWVRCVLYLSRTPGPEHQSSQWLEEHNKCNSWKRPLFNAKAQWGTGRFGTHGYPTSCIEKGGAPKGSTDKQIRDCLRVEGSGIPVMPGLLAAWLRTHTILDSERDANKFPLNIGADKLRQTYTNFPKQIPNKR